MDMDGEQAGAKRQSSMATAIESSERMELLLPILFEEFGFSYRDDLTEHPTEASSYERVYSAPWSDAETANEIKERLIADASGFTVSDVEDGLMLEITFPYPAPAIEERLELLHTVEFLEHGRAIYGIENEDRIMAIRVFRVIFSLDEPERMSPER